MSTELAAGLVKLTVRLVPVLLKLLVTYQPFKSFRHCMGRAGGIIDVWPCERHSEAQCRQGVGSIVPGKKVLIGDNVTDNTSCR